MLPSALHNHVSEYGLRNTINEIIRYPHFKLL